MKSLPFLCHIFAIQAHSYFGRFARWALREFLSEAASAVDQAKKSDQRTSQHVFDQSLPQQATATPAHILERLGVCIPLMEAAQH